MASHTIPVTKSTTQEETSAEQAAQPPLEGSCSCGRNQYTIHLPPLHTRPSVATLVIDTSLASRTTSKQPPIVSSKLTFVAAGQTHSSPLPTFLRVPLRSLHSSTRAFFPEEHHSEIRRVFTPAHAPRTKRHFCGFCGTQLSMWQEDSLDRNMEEWICVNLGTLKDEHVDVLEESGVFEQEEEDRGHRMLSSSLTADDGPTAVTVQSKRGDRAIRGQPWFEELIRDTGIGRIRQAQGGHISEDGRSRFEWQVVEFDGETVNSADAEQEEDTDMTGTSESRASQSKRKAEDIDA